MAHLILSHNLKVMSLWILGIEILPMFKLVLIYVLYPYGYKYLGIKKPKISHSVNKTSKIPIRLWPTCFSQANPCPPQLGHGQIDEVFAGISLWKPPHKFSHRIFGLPLNFYNKPASNMVKSSLGSHCSSILDHQQFL